MTAGNPSHTAIGSFEAKAKLSEILRKVQQGQRFTITVRGKAVADVVPSQSSDRQRVEEAVKQLRAMPRVAGVTAGTLKEWIEEGRE